MTADRKELIQVAAAQIRQCDDPGENAVLMAKYIREVEADILCFPETALSGLCKDWEMDVYHSIIQESARKAGKWVVYGSYDQYNFSHGQMVQNNAYLVNREGELVSHYAKMHLWNEPGVTPGVQNEVIPTELGNLAMIICWDIRYQESLAQLSRVGAEIILCPSYWFGEEFKTTDVIEGLPLSRAFENQTYFVYCDAFAPNGETSARSKICAPTKVLAAATPQREQVITATLDLNALRENRQLFGLP